MNRESNSDNQIIYQLNLNSASLGLISPYLFVERLRDEIVSKLPSIQTDVVYNPKDKGQALVQLKCFSPKYIPDYQVNNLNEEISFIAINLRDRLANRIEDAKRAVA